MTSTRKTRTSHTGGSGHARSLMRKSSELGMAVPQVVAHRLTRLAMAGPVMSSRDKAEFELMWAEKNQAFAQSWQAMAAQALRAQQALALTWTAALFNPFGLASGLQKSRARSSSSSSTPFSSGMSILNAGLEPVHRKALANAKRLRRTPLR